MTALPEARLVQSRVVADLIKRAGFCEIFGSRSGSTCAAPETLSIATFSLLLVADGEATGILALLMIRLAVGHNVASKFVADATLEALWSWSLAGSTDHFTPGGGGGGGAGRVFFS